MSDTDEGPVVGVFRLQLFKPSETFITGQAGALKHYRPVHIGRRLHGPAPAGAEMVVAPSGWRRLRLTLLADPGPLAAALGERRLDLIHAHFAVDAVYAARLARRLGAPLVVTLHGFDVSRSRRSMLASLRPALLHAVAGWRALTRGAALFLAVSQAVADAARARGAPPGRVHVAPVGVDLARLSPGRTGEAGLIVHVGRLVEKKGAATLLDAFAEIAPASAGLRLVIVGEGPLRPGLERRVRRLGLQGRVSLLGGLGHAAALDWLRRAEIVAVPSHVARNGDAEGLPTVLLEAAALGRAIVASDAGGIAEALCDGRSALLTPPGDAPALAAALRRLTADADLRARLGGEARRAVEDGYDLARQTGRLEQMYDEVVGAWTLRGGG